MMDLTQQPFTLGGSQWSCHGVYKHGLLRSVSSWDSVSGCLSVHACVCDSNVEYLKLKGGEYTGELMSLLILKTLLFYASSSFTRQFLHPHWQSCLYNLLCSSTNYFLVYLMKQQATGFK